MQMDLQCVPMNIVHVEIADYLKIWSNQQVKFSYNILKPIVLFIIGEKFKKIHPRKRDKLLILYGYVTFFLHNWNPVSLSVSCNVDILVSVCTFLALCGRHANLCGGVTFNSASEQSSMSVSCNVDILVSACIFLAICAEESTFNSQNSQSRRTQYRYHVIA